VNSIVKSTPNNLKGASNMNIQFETSQIGQAEAQGLISLLSSLFPTASLALNGPVPQPSAPVLLHKTEVADFETSAPPAVPAPALALVPAQSAQSVEPITTKRTRRTKAEMEAAAKPQAAPADPTPASAAQTAEVSVTTQSATASKSTVSADELRALLNGYIAKHSMEEAIGQLKTFGCNRVTEALSLEPEKLNKLAEALRG
jgi:hypothetical protein